VTEQPFLESSGDVPGAAAGWYPVDDGRVRYWDGEVWTDQFAPAPVNTGAAGAGVPVGSGVGGQVAGAVSSITDNQMAMFAHVGQLLGLVSGIGGFVVPLVILLTKGKESAFVRRAAVESLNFWITGFLATVVAFLLVFVLIGFVLLPLVALGWLIMPIVAGIKANEGVDYRYPINLRIVR